MGKIIAIGGGEIGRPGYPVETTKIDKEIIRLSGKKKPLVLFIPTASNDSELYSKYIQKHFGKRLGCAVDVLKLLDKKVSSKEIRSKILSADIVYVGGGNTLKMMGVWKRKGVDAVLKAAHQKGIVLCGVSAGAVCWFAHANSDSRIMNNPKAKHIKVTCLNFIPALLCPHYDAEKNRKSSLKKMMMKTAGVAIALDNCAAIECIDQTYRIITSKKTAHAYKVFWKDGKFHHNEIAEIKEFKPLSVLLKK